MTDMKIAIASGKGGTGKTLIATNLAWVMAEQGASVSYLDCDVEEPNGRLFLKPGISESRECTVPIPAIFDDKCTLCGECANVCRFNALAVMGDRVLFFPELCHSCGACTELCPEKAIREKDRPVGMINKGNGGRVAFIEGVLNIGEAQAPPVIKAVKASACTRSLTIIDSAPGTSCPVIEAISDCDFVVLVTEPTPFGLNDFILSVKMLRLLRIPFGAVINRSGDHDDIIESYCRTARVNVLGKIPQDRKIAELYSTGELVARKHTAFKAQLIDLAENIEQGLKS